MKQGGTSCTHRSGKGSHRRERWAAPYLEDTEDLDACLELGG